MLVSNLIEIRTFLLRFLFTKRIKQVYIYTVYSFLRYENHFYSIHPYVTPSKSPYDLPKEFFDDPFDNA